MCALARAVSSLSSDPPAPAAGPGARPGHARARRRVRPFFARVAGAGGGTVVVQGDADDAAGGPGDTRQTQ